MKPSLISVHIHLLLQLRRLSTRGQERGQPPAVTRQLRGAVSLVVLLGLTWLFALFAVGRASMVFQWLFTITNAFQVLRGR